jgi:hypothetical protein
LYSKHPWRSIGTIAKRWRGTIAGRSRVQGGRKPWRWRGEEGLTMKKASTIEEEEDNCDEEEPCRRRRNLYIDMRIF